MKLPFEFLIFTLSETSDKNLTESKSPRYLSLLLKINGI